MVTVLFAQIEFAWIYEMFLCFKNVYDCLLLILMLIKLLLNHKEEVEIVMKGVVKPFCFRLEFS